MEERRGWLTHRRLAATSLWAVLMWPDLRPGRPASHHSTTRTLFISWPVKEWLDQLNDGMVIQFNTRLSGMSHKRVNYTQTLTPSTLGISRYKAIIFYQQEETSHRAALCIQSVSKAKLLLRLGVKAGKSCWTFGPYFGCLVLEISVATHNLWCVTWLCDGHIVCSAPVSDY